MRRLLRLLYAFRDFTRRPRRFRARKNVRFGPKVTMGPDVLIGDYTFIGARSVIGPNPVVIGRFSSIAPDVLVGANSHPMDRASTSAYFYSPFWGAKLDQRSMHNKEVIRIGNDVWVGARAIVLPGVVIGDGAIVAAGAVVTKDVAPFSIVGGVPARHIRFRFSQEIAKELLLQKWWELEPEELNLEAFGGPYKGNNLSKSHHMN